MKVRGLIVEDVTLQAVPHELFAAAPFQSAAGWWRCVLAAGLPPVAKPHFLLARDAGRPLGLLPLCETPGGLGSLEGLGGLEGLVTPYTCLFQPLLAAGADPCAVGRAFARSCVRWPVLRLDALDADWSGWPGLLAGFAAGGRRAAWFDSFGNWHATANDGWEAYLAARPGALRETIRRKLRRAERDPAQTFRLAREPDEMEAAVGDYETVYRRSWKQPEPYPDFGPALLAEAAAAGVLRLGVLSREGTPLAAQYWIVEAGRATVLKLAHDEAEKTMSPGTALTAWMIRALLAEGVSELDFGRGDDPYKRLWASARRQRKGLILARLWHPLGAAALVRQAAGQVVGQFRQSRRGRMGDPGIHAPKFTP